MLGLGLYDPPPGKILQYQIIRIVIFTIIWNSGYLVEARLEIKN